MAPYANTQQRIGSNIMTTATKSDTPKRALTIEEFAERWSIGRNSVYNAIARGELHSVKIGKRVVVRVGEQPAAGPRERNGVKPGVEGGCPRFQKA